PRGGADAVAVGQVLEDRQRWLLGQLGPEPGRPLPLGEPRLAGAAVKHPALLVLAVAGADRQVAGPALAMIGAVLVQATEAGQVLGHGDTSQPRVASGASSSDSVIHTKDLPRSATLTGPNKMKPMGAPFADLVPLDSRRVRHGKSPGLGCPLATHRTS